MSVGCHEKRVPLKVATGMLTAQPMTSTCIVVVSQRMLCYPFCLQRQISVSQRALFCKAFTFCLCGAMVSPSVCKRWMSWEECCSSSALAVVNFRA